jgi:hypothetical protein
MWQAEQGRPYFLAKAGIAYPGWLVTLMKDERNRVSIKQDFRNDRVPKRRSLLPEPICIHTPPSRKKVPRIKRVVGEYAYDAGLKM